MLVLVHSRDASSSTLLCLHPVVFTSIYFRISLKRGHTPSAKIQGREGGNPILTVEKAPPDSPLK